MGYHLEKMRIFNSCLCVAYGVVEGTVQNMIFEIEAWIIRSYEALIEDEGKELSKMLVLGIQFSNLKINQN